MICKEVLSYLSLFGAARIREEAVPEDSRSDTPIAVLVLMICQPMSRAKFWETEIWCCDT